VTKLNQILAIERGEKEKSYKELTTAHHGLKQKGALTGFSKTYQPIAEDGEVFPPERQVLQTRAHRVVEKTQKILRRHWDLVATRDWTNCDARADLVLHPGTDQETVLIESVPASHLLWLEKQLNDLHTFCKDLPVLPADEEWQHDDQQDCFRSPPIKSVRTKKIVRPMVKYEATKEHPAQVDLVQEDQTIGHWTTTKFSGALEATRVEVLKDRVRALQRAVKFARERANSVEVVDQRVADKVFGYLFE
jgi:hypothetical protein